MRKLKFTSKAKVLEELRPLLKTGYVLPQVCISSANHLDAASIWNVVLSNNFAQYPLIVRSSAKNEDTEQSSNAGKFLSIGNICGKEELMDAIQQVASAMGHDEENEVFIQPYLQDVDLCGVVFTADPNTGGNYYVINYDIGLVYAR